MGSTDLDGFYSVCQGHLFLAKDHMWLACVFLIPAGCPKGNRYSVCFWFNMCLESSISHLKFPLVGKHPQAFQTNSRHIQALER